MARSRIEVAVEDAAHGVGDRLVVVVAVDQHGEDAGDVAGALDAGAGALEQPRQFGEDGGRIALGGRRLAGGEADLAQRHGEARDAVHQAEHLQALVAEMLGHGQGEVGGLAAHQRRLVGGGDHDDAAGGAFGAEIGGEEFLHLAAALADQADDDHVGVGVAGHHAEQGRLADARAGEDAHALAAAEVQQRVHGAHADIELLADAAAEEGGRRAGAQGIGEGAGGQRALAVDRFAQTVNRTAEPAAVGPHGDAAVEHDDGAADADAAEVLIGHQQAAAVADADDLAQHLLPAPGLDRAAVADGEVAFEAVGLDGDAVGALDLADQPEVRQPFDFGDGLGDPQGTMGGVGWHGGSVAARLYARVKGGRGAAGGRKRQARRNPAVAKPEGRAFTVNCWLTWISRASASSA